MNSYWDPSLDNSKYSFVDWVISQGYSIFYYDRLGIGESTKVSGYYAQRDNQAAVLTELAKLVKAGKYVGGIGKPKSVVLVGHSIGSNIATQAITNDLTLADGLILTGYSFNQSIQNPKQTFGAINFRIAQGQKPSLWGGLDTVCHWYFQPLYTRMLTRGCKGLPRPRRPISHRSNVGFPLHVQFESPQQLTRSALQLLQRTKLRNLRRHLRRKDQTTLRHHRSPDLIRPQRSADGLQRRGHDPNG